MSILDQWRLRRPNESASDHRDRLAALEHSDRLGREDAKRLAKARANVANDSAEDALLRMLTDAEPGATPKGCRMAPLTDHGIFAGPQNLRAHPRLATLRMTIFTDTTEGHAAFEAAALEMHSQSRIAMDLFAERNGITRRQPPVERNSNVQIVRGDGDGSVHTRNSDVYLAKPNLPPKPDWRL